MLVMFIEQIGSPLVSDCLVKTPDIDPSVLAINVLSTQLSEFAGNIYITYIDRHLIFLKH